MRDYEQFDELFEAVFGGDLARAEAVLNELQMIGGEYLAGRIRAAKQKVRPENYSRSDSPVREVFPVPGHLPGSMMANPRLDPSEPVASRDRRAAGKAA